MMLKLIRDTRTRYAFRCSLVEREPFTEDKLLASVSEKLDNPMLELFYPLAVTRSGISLRGRPVQWKWRDANERKKVLDYLRLIQNSGEEIRLEITRKQPDWPGYPYVNHNAYARAEPCYTLIRYEKENNDGDD